MIWAATGTRRGGTPYQLATVGWLFSRLGITVLHDGDAIGVDEQLYHMARAFGAHVILHPPSNTKYRAFCGDNKDTFLNPKPYHERDENMVDEAEALVACPLKPFEMDYGGTWYTIDYARKAGKPIAIVWPNGHITYENWTLSHDQAGLRRAWW